MTSARIQPFCRKFNINSGYYYGLRGCPRNNRQRNKAIKLPKNHFCLLWKSNRISSNKAIEDELKPIFQVVNNVVSDKLVKKSIKTNTNLEKNNLN